MVSDPNIHHVALDGVVRHKDDPFWRTYYLPNGWGCRCKAVGVRSPDMARRLGGDWDKPLPQWVGQTGAKGAPVGIDKGFAYAPGESVVERVRALAAKTIQWEYMIAKAFMDVVPLSVRDALAMAQRAQPETAETIRRYAERAIGERNGAPVPAPTQPYQTIGLLTRSQALEIAHITGIEQAGTELYDWTISRDSVAHIRNEHGDPEAEARRGQAAVVADDYRLLPFIIERAERTIDAGETATGNRAVELIKHIGDVEYHAIFEVLTRRRMLALKTMYKVRRQHAPPV